MKLCSTSLYLEVGCKFLISHKVDNFMIALLKKEIMRPNELDISDPEVFLDLQVTTDSSCTSVRVIEPEGIEDDFLVWKIWLPYKQIVNSDNYLEEYLDCFFDGAVQVFSYYNIDAESILSVKKSVKKEVLKNSEYEYIEEYVSKVAKYDFD